MKEWFKNLWASLFPHEKWVRWVLTGFVIAFLWASCTLARASELSAEGGVQYIRGPAAAITTQLVFPGPGDADIEAGLLLVGQRPNGERGVMGAQVLVVDGFGKFDLGLGVAHMNRRHEQLGSSTNFALLVRYNLPKGWYLSIRHWSNASTTDENTGLDVLTFGRKFQ